MVGYAGATCPAWHLSPLGWEDVVDGEPGSARPASLWTNRGVSSAAPQPAARKNSFYSPFQLAFFFFRFFFFLGF